MAEPEIATSGNHKVPSRASKQFTNTLSLQKWALAGGATLNPAVEIYNDPATGISFRVGADGPAISPGDSICSCPMGLTLSYLNLLGIPAFPPLTKTVVADVDTTTPFPARFVAETPPHVLSRFVLMHEFEHRSESPWAPYLHTLPWPEDETRADGGDEDGCCYETVDLLPSFWPAETRKLFDGTNVGVAAERIAANARREWLAAISLLESSLGSRHWGGVQWQPVFSEKRYNWACSILSSRSFRPSLVVPNQDEVVSFLPEGVTLVDFPILMPLFDIGNHEMRTKITWDNTTSKNECTWITGTPFQPGDQVYNNYGQKTNSELLLGYGFMIPATPALHNDYIHLNPRGDVLSSREGNIPTGFEHLASLRPIVDPSTARAHRLLDRSRLPGPVLPAFAHVEDLMVWAMLAAQTTAEQRDAMFSMRDNAVEVAHVATTTDQVQLALFLMGWIETTDGVEVYERTVTSIYDKMMVELEKLREADFDLEGGVDDREKRRRALAWDYRNRCRMVLEAVIESITHKDS